MKSTALKADTERLIIRNHQVNIIKNGSNQVFRLGKKKMNQLTT